jgi:hypothetical protein
MATMNSNASYVYSDAPEVVHHAEPGLEPIEHSTLEPVLAEAGEERKHDSQQYSNLEHHPHPYDASRPYWKQDPIPTAGSPTENTPALRSDEDSRAQGGAGHVRRRKKWYLVGGLLAILAIIAIVLGCVLGLRKKDSSGS